MRRGLAFLPVLLWAATSASAQAPLPLPPNLPPRMEQLLTINTIQLPVTGATATVDDVVARLLSFDRDKDGRVTRVELPERMQAILPRGDANLDDALDATEIRTLSHRPAELTVRGFPQLHGGGYGFADEGSVSSLSHIQGALEDLRLASDRRDEALPLVTAFSQALDADASKELLTAMQPLLSEEHLADFTRALDVRNPKRVIFSLGSQAAPHQVFMIGPDLSRRIAMYGLGPAERGAALEAIERYKDRLRPGERDRAALLDEMKGILTAEERDDFRAALERRPVVKSGAAGVAGNVVDTIAPPGRPMAPAPLVRPAVLIER